MAGEPEVQVSRFLDEHGLGAFQIKLLFWSILIAFIDGYDIGAIAFAAPHLIRDMAYCAEATRAGAQRQQFRRAVRLADLRLDRRPLRPQDRADRAQICCSACSPTAAAYSTNLTEMFWLRLHRRARHRRRHPQRRGDQRRIGAAHTARDAGDHRRRHACRSAARSPASPPRRFVPQYGWQILFQIGGIVPIVIALAAIIGLPESIKYMALHESQRRKMEALLAAIRPDFEVPPNARFVIEDEKQFAELQPGLSVPQRPAADHAADLADVRAQPDGLFLPHQLDADADARRQVPPATAALAGAALQVGGTVGALVLCWWLQRHRFLAIAILFVIAVPVVGSIGYAGLTSHDGAADGDVLRRRRWCSASSPASTSSAR